ncbi:MAG: hypothetical protein M1818_002432 [Claussenomyces sp. TS43310]|nr:MAG: hypothetical protein M1818_002432 [Claussenomyces sp. TS43310]
MFVAPFDLERQLYHRLYINTNLKRSIAKKPKARGPKDSDHDELHKLSQANPALPGQPQLLLSNVDSLRDHLALEFTTAILDSLSQHFWLIATPDSTHISSLTHQIVRGRSLVVTEKGYLHLLWYHDRIFIKPLPKYLLSRAFWEYYFSDSVSSPLGSQTLEISQAAKGFLRTYVYLIQHKSDFILAQSLEPPIIPKSLKYGPFMRFLADCQIRILDEDVSSRYHYGDLRLSRVNFWIQIFQGRTRYFNMNADYGNYFSRYLGFILFMFGVMSVILNAMQVAVAVPGDVRTWPRFEEVSRWFSIVVIVFVVFVLLFLFGKLLVRGVREGVFAVNKVFLSGSKAKKERDKKGDV